MFVDISKEIRFKTTRSGGRGGQNVNKVETAVVASFRVDESVLLTDEQKLLLKKKLSNKINAHGLIQLKSQLYRTQLENKKNAAEKLNEWVNFAFKKRKPRIATQPSKASIEKRIEWKKRNSALKAGRRKPGYNH